MSWLKGDNLARLNNTIGSMALLAVVTAVAFVARSAAQTMQKGISVELAATSSAVPVPEADNPNALIITVTDSGKLYFGIEAVTPHTLAEKLKSRPSVPTETLYIKADARAPYAYVVKVVDMARTSGVASVTLLTAQPITIQAGTIGPPEGIEMELARRSPPAK